MAIEFNCPYCTAAIRVPDAYGGKQGRCPKCDTHLLVPTVFRPETHPPGTTAAGTAAAGQPSVPSTPQTSTDPFVIKPVAPSPKRKTTRRRTSRTLVVGIPVICFLILLGLIFYSVTSGFPQIGGEVVAKRFGEKLLPKMTIAWADIGLPEEDQATLKEFLEKTPEILKSQVMTCRLIGSSEGIEVSLTAGPESDWFAVELGTNKPLALWLKNERSALNVRRTQLLRKAVVSYCADKLKQIAGEHIGINAMQVRDEVGIHACTGALGSVLQGSTGKLLIPCAYEDEQSRMYFCLPAGTLSFQIDGKVDANGQKLFPGIFTAVVSSVAAPVPTESAAPDDAGNAVMEKDEPKTDGDKDDAMKDAPDSDDSAMEPNSDTSDDMKSNGDDVEMDKSQTPLGMSKGATPQNSVFK